MRKLFFLSIYLCSVFLSSAQADDKLPLDSALSNILMQIYLFPQEKMYLQTDRPYYISGEKIFFRAFLLNALTHQPTEMSRYVYVELINSKDSVVVRHQIRPENNIHYGAISLPENLPQGNYRIRSYTRFMENIGDDYFFTQPVYIADPEVDLQIQENYSSDEKFEVIFYPEGGNLIAGQSCNIAFKALSSNGNAIEISGEIFDSQNNQQTNFSTVHEGMGRFILKPEAGQKYYAICQAGNQNIKVNLPETKTDACALATVWRQNKLWISVKQSEETFSQKMYLFIHTGGLTIYANEWDFSKEFVTIDKNNFPDGISHIFLLNEDFYPLSERLVFALNDDWLTADIKTQKDNYKTRDFVKLDVECQGIVGQAHNDKSTHGMAGQARNDSIMGSFAISITDDKDIKIDKTSNILTNILLTSELKGYIAAPSYYFQKDNREAEFAADLLMMTHGWNRYNIPSAMRGDFQFLTVPNEESQLLTGIVKGGLLSKPYKNASVMVLSTNSSFFDQMETDENGLFKFDNFEFPDSTNYFIQALSKRGKGIVELIVDDIIYPKISPTKRYFAKQKEQQLPELEEFNDYVVKANQKYTYENGMRTVNLPEVTVRGRKMEDQPSSSWFPLNVVQGKEFEVLSAGGDIRGILSRFPVEVGRGGVIARGKLILNEEQLNDLNLRIYDMKAVVYGSGGFGFVFKGFNDIEPKFTFNKKIYAPLGYQIPIEFYSPRYDTPEARNNTLPDLRSTIYWKPDAIVDFVGKTTLDFYTADSPSTYSVVVEGVTPEGKLIYTRADSFIKVE